MSSKAWKLTQQWLLADVFDSMFFAENEMWCDQANPAALEAARRVLRNVEANHEQQKGCI